MCQRDSEVLMIKKIYYYLKVYGLIKSLWYMIREAQFVVKMALLNTYTPFGEDIIIDNLLGKKSGFYVDIGAHDPSRFSNSKRFYRKGWRGINIEPNPECIKKFNKSRPRDINLNVGIANKNGVLDFYIFEPESLSTFSKEVSRSRQKYGYKLIKTTPIKVVKLDYILTKYCKNKSIDFFSIDTEGLDLEVLRSNNWKRFRPKVICIEISSLTFENPDSNNPKRKMSPTTEKLLTKLGYKKTGETISNMIFQYSSKKL